MDRFQTIREHLAFRRILDAFARPGTPQFLTDESVDRATAFELFAACLLDSESSLAHLWDEDAETTRRIAILTGCRLVSASDADFVLAGVRGAGSRLSDLRIGDPDYPDRGSTAIHFVDKIRPSGGILAWKGPGIDGVSDPWFEGLPDTELPALRDANSSYPLGLDAVFIDLQGCMVALPRSTRLEEKRP